MPHPLKVIITGSTGMVGEGVLIECLASPIVEQVLVINRKPCGYQHPKLKELIHADFFDLSPLVPQLTGYNACLFCLGVSSVGMKEPEYTRLTHTLTMHVAETLIGLNPGMSFSYISGAYTDSSEKGRSMWARVKGKTENDLMKLPFSHVYAFRPFMLFPTAGMKHALPYYKYLGFMFPLMRAIGFGCTLSELGQAMINAAAYGYPKQHIELKDIITLSKHNA